MSSLHNTVVLWLRWPLSVVACFCILSPVGHFEIPWTNLPGSSDAWSMEFSTQECWSELSLHSPRDLPDPGMELASPASPALAGMFFTINATWEAPLHSCRDIHFLTGGYCLKWLQVNLVYFLPPFPILKNNSLKH